jgi:hypothetical protein
MLLTKATGGTAIAGFEWEHDGDTVDVPIELAVELITIDPVEFSVPDSKGDSTFSEITPAAELSESPPPRRRKGGKGEVEEGTEGKDAK